MCEFRILKITIRLHVNNPNVLGVFLHIECSIKKQPYVHNLFHKKI